MHCSECGQQELIEGCLVEGKCVACVAKTRTTQSSPLLEHITSTMREDRERWWADIKTRSAEYDAELTAPFPYWGGKRRVAQAIWARFGDTPNYVEPFCGSAAVLLARPWPFRSGTPHLETINDIDQFVCNFWRSVKKMPDEVAKWADHPVIEGDLVARNNWLVRTTSLFRKRIVDDPEYCSPKVAGYWVYAMSAWIGSGCCDVSGGGHPVGAKLPHVGPGSGIHRQLGEERGADGACAGRTAATFGYLGRLADRLRHVTVPCGDFMRVLSPAYTTSNGITAVLLDPPYCGEDRSVVYTNDSFAVAHTAAEWARANGDNPDFRIALCGYEGEYEMPATWQVYAWKASGGMANTRKSGEGQDNCRRERIWFSPHCNHDGFANLPMFKDVPCDGDGPQRGGEE